MRLGTPAFLQGEQPTLLFTRQGYWAVSWTDDGQTWELRVWHRHPEEVREFWLHSSEYGEQKILTPEQYKEGLLLLVEHEQQYDCRHITVDAVEMGSFGCCEECMTKKKVQWTDNHHIIAKGNTFATKTLTWLEWHWDALCLILNPHVS